MAGKYVAYGSRLRIRFNRNPMILYCAQQKDANGIPPEVALPRPLQCMIPRAVYRRWIVNRFLLDNSDSSLELSAPDGSRFASMTLQEGDEAFVAMHRVIAWTGGVQFRTRISFQLAAMALARMFFVSARGPGTLFFEMCGKPELRKGVGQSQSSINFSRVIAWDREVRFEITGSTRMRDIYFSPMHVRPLNEGTILIGPDDRSERSGGLVWQLLSRIYLPQ